VVVVLVVLVKLDEPLLRGVRDTRGVPYHSHLMPYYGGPSTHRSFKMETADDYRVRQEAENQAMHARLAAHSGIPPADVAKVMDAFFRYEYQLTPPTLDPDGETLYVLDQWSQGWAVYKDLGYVPCGG
jgi:hypothetical protein